MSNPLGKTHQNLGVSWRLNLEGRSAGKLRGQKAPNSSELPPLTTPQVIRGVQSIVLQFPIKQIADEAGSTPRAVENVRNGECAMSLRNFFNLCRANPRVRALAAPLMGLEETDPDFVQGMSLLMNSLVRQRGMPAPTDDFAGGDEEPAAGDLFGGTVQ